jgi:hypothetical protein
MATNRKQTDFIASDEGQRIRQELSDMLTNQGYTTESTYNTNSDLYPDNKIPFVEKHMHYIATHPSVDPNHYLANLRLITKVR